MLVFGAPKLSSPPFLIEGNGFQRHLFAEPEREADLLVLDFPPPGPQQQADLPRQLAEARRAIESGKYDAALYFPPDFAQRLESFRRLIEQAPAMRSNRRRNAGSPDAHCGNPQSADHLYHGQRAFADRPRPPLGSAETLDGSRRQEQPGRRRRAGRGGAALRGQDQGRGRRERLSRRRVVVENPAGDAAPLGDDRRLLSGGRSVAGEKERGTLETLLSSPAERSEIVLGKLLTIMGFSMATAVLNLVSMGAAGWLIFGRVPEFGPPPPLAPLWLAIALVPVSALYSALCLALAAFARSTREGQYYLVPLMLVTMPLAVLPMTPGVELTVGSSLIPVTGVVLLLRNMLEGSYWPALQYLPLVLGVTLAACFLAVRWAVEQFNSETVLFRASEQFDVGLWLRHLLRDRQPTPTVGMAVFCGVLILLIRFFFDTVAKLDMTFAGFARATIVMQLAAIAAPAILMAVLLTSRPRQTLLLKLPRWPAIPAALALAVALHPVVERFADGRPAPLSHKL